MLEFKDYIADWPDLPSPNFIAWVEEGRQRWGNKTAIYYRSGKQKDFSVWTYNKLAEECKRIARGLLAAGLTKGDRVVLWAENRPEWMAVWLGSAIAGAIIVPVDFLVSEQECANILKLTRAKGFFYSARKQEFADSLGAAGPNQDISLKVRSCITDNGKPGFSSFGLDAGDQKLPLVSDIDAHDPVSIVFTSGTTGFAKGVTLHHKGIIANASAAIISLRAYEDDVFINVLPLHHTYPTTCSFIAPLSIGAATIIVEKLVGKVVIDDIRDAGGTFLIAVPLLYDKVKAAIDQGYQKLPGIVKAVLNIFRKIALERAKKGDFQFGQKFFMFIRKKASLASIRMMVAGGGPLSPQTADFFDSLGFNIVQGYGMSENSPLISVSTPWHKNNYSVGLRVKYTDVKIIDKNEEGIGEIAAKSPSLMVGYWENPDATAEVFTEDGYLLTGDLGYIDDLGFVFINGRKKNLIVSSGGKNVYPEEIEVHFDGSRVVGEIIVVGRKEAEFGGERIFAVAVPHYENLAIDYPGKDLSDGFIRELIKKEIERVNRSLVGYKKITDFTIRKESFEKNAQQKIKRFLYMDYTKAPAKKE
ncbi:MAG: AMP-binding protein [Spirochaetaceae bacterium]|jgi:long-chain acyl-CoA synthetase|nr:AMP-binding protein [Spirochaetaceae bacterium]